ncbi:hypothetical protein K437DRAFT_257229 [Tilletiaria anomala UBC 951]|uniref:LIM zinc-binding domain-containing protein n=1 Tax=Tilletiaria anomala (strain ATCC 24038 / CBS 436.72 / UBC 951) TaxID=1037660 RepID=A0A066VRH2_TILAU|nr:uncharacterized protein K437DRAFT_257229 [Tilletiaria anomala UBC 951]KDN44091.1 hypothetical protein K437DRAFT_257229 [Tilletiaria anomala UBC 951]
MATSVRPRSSDGKPKSDAWANRYLLGEDTSSLAIPQDSSGMSASRSSSFDEDRKALRQLHASTLATSAGLTMGLASSISRDLYSSSATNGSSGSGANSRCISLTAPSTGGAYTSRSSQPSSPLLTPSTSFAPTIADPMSGALSKVVGSLVEPQETRDKWNCKRCHSIFARDATIYAAPSSGTISSSAATPAAEESRGRQPADSASRSRSRDRSPATRGSDPGAYYCRSCYIALYALGSCAGCTHPILGTTKEDGPFVRVSSTDELYHGRCFKCGSCGKGGGKPPLGDGIEIIIGMKSKPTCLECFDKPMKLASVQPASGTHSLTMPPSEGEMQSHELQGRKGLSGNAARKTKMAASIAELSRRFGKGSAVGASSGTGLKTKMAPPSLVHSQPVGSGGGVTSSRSTNSFSGAASTPSPVISPSSSFGMGMGTSTGRPASPTKPKPLTAQFTGTRFNLAAFQSTRPGHLSRSDSRSRSLSPVKRAYADVPQPANASKAADDIVPTARASFDVPRSTSRVDSMPAGSHAEAAAVRVASSKCALCGFGPFEGLQKGVQEAVMVGLQSGEQLHRECFNCGVCAHPIDASKPFVRLEDLLSAGVGAQSELSGDLGRREGVLKNKYAHTACAPISLIQRPSATSATGASHTSATLTPPASSAQDHATHQRTPRSRGSSPAPNDKAGPVLVSSYLPKQTGISVNANAVRTDSKVSVPASIPASAHSHPSMRTFKPTAGAAPPTKSAFLTGSGTSSVHANGTPLPSESSRNPAAGMFATQPKKRATSPGGVQQHTWATSMGSGTTTSTAPSAARFGGMQACPACQRTVTALESVPGPRGTRWHRACLVCCGDGGAGCRVAARKCGKKLDSGAKVDAEGRVMCRDCFDKTMRESRVLLAK